ncbi:COG1470 family protein [Cellulomonas sp. P5_C5]
MDPVLVLAQDTLATDPGGQVRTRVTVRNVGDIVAQYRVEVLGEASRWSTVVPQHVSVLPGESEEQTVEIVFRPPPAPAAPVGTIPFGVRCVSLENRDVAAVVEGDVVVSPVQGLDVRLRGDGPKGARAGRFRVELRNTGTTDLTVTLEVADAAELLRFGLAPQVVEVPAGRTVPAYLAVQARNPKLLGKPVPHAFTVTYRVSRSDRVGELPGTFEQRAVVRKLWVVLALLLVVAGVLGYLWLRGQGGAEALRAGTPPPVEVEALEVVGPGEVRVVWLKSPYATGYGIEEWMQGVSGTSSEPVDDSGETSFRWEELTEGEHCFRVRALAGDVPGSFGKEECVVVPPAEVAPTETPEPTESAPAAGQAGAPFEPQGWYVRWGNFPQDDAANAGAADALVAQLQLAGALGVQLKSSADSAAFLEGANGVPNWVVFTEGLPDELAAKAQCDTFRSVASQCIWQKGAS